MLLSFFNRLISSQQTRRYSAGQSAAVILFSYYFQSGLNFLGTKRKSLLSFFVSSNIFVAVISMCVWLIQKATANKYICVSGADECQHHQLCVIQHLYCADIALFSIFAYLQQNNFNKTFVPARRIPINRRRRKYAGRWWQAFMTASKFEHLLMLLDKAEFLSKEFSGGYSGQFLSAEEFHKALKQAIDKLKQGDNTQLKTLYLWFAPTCSWDDFVGQEGLRLGNEIFELLSKLIKF